MPVKLRFVRGFDHAAVLGLKWLVGVRQVSCEGDQGHLAESLFWALVFSNIVSCRTWT